MRILADASLPNLLTLFPKPCHVTPYQTHEMLLSLLPSHELLICRSTLQVNADLLEQSPIKCVATASSGTDHIEKNYLASRHIQLFDAKGCNAISVADYVTATLAWLEKHRKISGKKAGVIGLGKVGAQVAHRLHAAGYHVVCCDPYIAHTETRYQWVALDALSDCDLICLHANLHQDQPYPSLNLINAQFFSQLKPGVAFINASRGDIVNEIDLLNIQNPIHYCTDVYSKEPNINPEVIDFATLCTPHIAGHSVEAKQNAMIQLSFQIHQYLGLHPPVTPNLSPHVEWVLENNRTWIEIALSLYNPYEDTLVLKKHALKHNAFITQRQAHQNRHDFDYLTHFC